MKTTDSVMREFEKEIKIAFDCIWVNAVNWERSKLPGKQVPSVYKMASKNLEKLYSHSLAEARREERTKIYHDLLNKQEFVTYKKDGGRGVAVPMSWVLDLLTGDNPEEAK